MFDKKAFTIVEILTVIAIIAILAAILLPALQRAKGQAQRSNCMSNLKQFSMAYQLFGQDHNGKFPQDANDIAGTDPKPIYPEYISEPKIFWCPEDSDGEPSSITTSNYTISYAFTLGKTIRDNVDDILIQDNSDDNHLGAGKNILYLDGHVKWVPNP